MFSFLKNYFIQKAHFVLLMMQNTSPRANTHFLKKTRHHFLLCSAEKSTQALSVFAIRVGGSEDDEHCMTVNGHVWLKMSADGS